SRRSGAAVCRDGYDRAELDVVEQLSVAQGRGAMEDFQRAADALASDVHAARSQLERAVIREKIGDVVPHLAVEVVAETVLEVAYFGFVVQTLYAQRERADSLAVRTGGGFPGEGLHGARRNRDTDIRGLEVIRDLPGRRRLVTPVIVRAAVLLEVSQTADLPDAVLERVFILVDTPEPGCTGTEASEHRHLVPRAPD